MYDACHALIWTRACKAIDILQIYCQRICICVRYINLIIFKCLRCARPAFMMTGVDGAALGSSSRVLAIVPMFHANSWGLVFAAPLVGACLVLPGVGLQQHCPFLQFFLLPEVCGIPWMNLHWAAAAACWRWSPCPTPTAKVWRLRSFAALLVGACVRSHFCM